MVEVGSMEVIGIYKDGGLITNLHLVESITKSLKTEYQRMTTIAVAAGEAIADIGKRMLSSITNALTSSPYLIGALTKIKTFIMLLAWEISKVLRPVLDWLSEKVESLYRWFKDLSPEIKEATSWFIILAGAIMASAIAAKLLGVPLGFIKDILVFVGEKFLALAGYLAGSTVAIMALWVGLGLLVGMLGVLALDELGILDWISDLGKNFREARNDGNLLYDILTILATPLAILGDLFLVLVTDKTMENFWKDVDTITESLKDLWDALNVFNKPVGTWIRDRLPEIKFPEIMGAATGRFVESDMIIKAHAGERIIPANSNSFDSGGGETNIIVDFSGAVIKLASGIDLEDFANTISRKIADKQAWTNY